MYPYLQLKLEMHLVSHAEFAVNIESFLFYIKHHQTTSVLPYLSIKTYTASRENLGSSLLVLFGSLILSAYRAAPLIAKESPKTSGMIGPKLIANQSMYNPTIM